MIHAVLDANVIASGLPRFRLGTSPPAKILQAWMRGRFELLISDRLLDEVVRTLSKPYFRAHVEPEVLSAALRALRHQATRIPLTVAVAGVAAHAEDDFVLSAAVSGNADYLVTGDHQLLRLRAFQEVIIVSPPDFVVVLDAATDTAV